MSSDLSFDWDAENIAHLARHRVTPAEFEQAMRNDPIFFGYDIVDGEERWAALGSTGKLRVIVAWFTMRNGRMRAVTAFNASKARIREFWRRRGN
jgi:uncharacterized DUF497 family protein